MKHRKVFQSISSFSPEVNLFPKKFKFTPSCWFFLTRHGSKLYSGAVPRLFSRSNLWNRFRFKSVRYLPFKLYFDTFILPYFLSFTSPTTLKLLPTYGPWNILNRANDILLNKGYLPLSLNHQFKPSALSIFSSTINCWW